MTIGAQFATIAYVETMRRNLMLAISGAGVTALPPASESEEGIDTFLGLTDTPDDYTSMAGRIPTVNAAEDALEFNPYVLASPAAPIITVRNMSDGDVDLVHKWASGATPVVKYSDGLDLTDGNYIWCNTDGLVDTTIGGTGWGTSLIVCDYTNNRVKQHLASTLAYSSQVASAGARYCCTDGTNYYVSDGTNHQIRKYLIATNALLWTVGTQGSGDDQFDFPEGICTDSTYLYIADATNNRIKQHLCSTGAYVAKFGSYGSVGGTFNSPRGICTDGTYLYITQNSNLTTRILKHLCSDLSYVSCLANDGHIDGTTNYDICTDGSFLYLINANNSALNSIFKYTRALAYVSEYGANGTGDAQFSGPKGICTDKTYLYVTDTGNDRIKKHLVSDYSYVAQIGTDGIGDDNFKSPWGICVGYLGEPRTGRLLRLRQDGSHFEVWPKLDLYNHLVFREDSALATDYVALKAPSAITASYTLTLPAADAAGALTSDGAGTLSFAAVCPIGAKYIVQEADSVLTAEQSLGALTTGILKNTVTGSTGVLSIAVGTDLPAHVLDSAVHSVSGLTSGHFLKATGAATFGFAAHGLTASDVGAEPALGNPGTNDYVLSSKTDGTRSWVAAGGGGGAPTDAQYVCLATNGSLSAERVLTGTANQITITDNGANGTVVLSTPQNIHSGASPTFAGLTVDTDTIYVDATNHRLGVNTTTPAYDVDISSSGNVTHRIYTSNGGALVKLILQRDAGILNLYNDGNSGFAGMQFHENISFAFTAGLSNDWNSLLFSRPTDGTMKISAKYSGASGNGNHVILKGGSGGGNAYVGGNLFLEAGDGDTDGHAAFRDATGATEYLTILSDGKIGINDSSPAEYLDVNGNINVTGVYKVDDVQIALNDLGDVATGALTDQDVLTYDSASGKWISKIAPGFGSGAPTNAEYVVEAAHAGLSAEVVLGTTVITTAAYASRQAAAKAGRLYFPSDSFFIERDTGAAWAPWGPIFPMTPVVSGDFAWINQGTASVDTTYGGVYIKALAAAGDNLKIRKKSKTGTYSIICCFLPHLASVNYSSCGLLWRQSSDGKLITVGFHPSESTIRVIKWTNETTYSNVYATPFTITNIRSGPLWLKLQDEGTNRKAFWSTDGRHWLQIHTVGRTDFLTADEVGFYANAGNATYDCGATFLSWEETA